MHYLMGDRTAALRQYQRCRDVLIEDFGIHPSMETEDLFARVAALAPQPMGVDEDALSQDITVQISSLREKLRQVQVLLGELDHLVQHQIADSS